MKISILAHRILSIAVRAAAPIWAALLLLVVAGCSNSAPPANNPTPAPGPALTPILATVLPATPAPGLPTPAATTLTVAPATPAPTGGNPVDWPTYHGDLRRTGYVANMPDPRQLKTAWNVPLDGAVYAQPLVIGGHMVAVTEGDSLYSLNAATGQTEWRTNIGQPVPRSSLPCGNIDPLGITGTSVYDPASGLVFAVAEVSGPAHVLVGLDLKTGAVRVRRSVDPQGMNPLAHQQRAGLTLWQGYVYIAFGGLYGDCGDYHGWVVASRTDGTGALLSYQVPTGREGGIWAAAGPTIDASGNLYVSVGNGSEVAGNWDKSDSVLRFLPSLQLQDGFAPDQWRQDNLADADLGSLSPALLPNRLIFIAGKAGIAYLLHADALGGIGGQVQATSLCHAYGGAAVVGSMLFVPCNEGVQQVQISAGPSLSPGWRASGVPGSPVVGGHTVYSLDRGGTLHALDINTGKDRATLPVGATTRFATPALYGNQIFVGTMAGVVAVTLTQ
ncbi:MAG: PQQ-binding-like beta-propeller repeat protein [Anaerolineae bacterium]